MQKVTRLSSNNITGGLLLRNTFWNLIGRGTPLILAFVAIPLLIKGIGTDRFGVLTLAWMVIGYFSLFDFGIGRALTMLVAKSIGAGDEENVHSLVCTGLLLMGALGGVGGGVGLITTPWLAINVLKVPPHLLTEAIYSFYILSFTIPFVVVTAGLVGILEAHQRFGAINTVRLFMGVQNYLGPLIVLSFSTHLPVIVGFMALGRFIAFIVYLQLCIKTVPRLGRAFEFKPSHLKPIISFGGWMTVSNVVSPIMVYMDRFFIGAIISVTAVAYYTTPYEVITKVSIIPEAIVNAMFSALTISLVSDRDMAFKHFRQIVKLLFVTIFPIMLITVLFASEGLNLWLNADFSQNSTLVLKILAAGFFVNSLARLPFILIQSAGKNRISAQLHLLELIIYLPALWWCTNRFGIVGAACAWSGRAALDMLLLFVAVFHIMPELRTFINRTLLVTASLLLVLLASTGFSGIGKLLFAACFLALHCVLSWKYLPEQRKFIQQKISRFKFAGSL